MKERSQPFLIAGPRGPETQMVTNYLSLLGFEARKAYTVDQVLELIRSNIFANAIVAVELVFEGKPILAKLAQLPSIKCLIATGPAQDRVAEKAARLAGADMYLPRPPTLESLAKALWQPTSNRLAETKQTSYR